MRRVLFAVSHRCRSARVSVGPRRSGPGRWAQLRGGILGGSPEVVLRHPDTTSLKQGAGLLRGHITSYEGMGLLNEVASPVWGFWGTTAGGCLDSSPAFVPLSSQLSLYLNQDLIRLPGICVEYHFFNYRGQVWCCLRPMAINPRNN